MSNEHKVCECKEREGDNEYCPIHGEKQPIEHYYDSVNNELAEKDQRISELELRINELETELFTINELYGAVLPSLGHRIDEIISKSPFKKFL